MCLIVLHNHAFQFNALTYVSPSVTFNLQLRGGENHETPEVGNFSMIVLLCVMFNLDRAVINTQSPGNKHHLSVELMGRHVLLLSCK